MQEQEGNQGTDELRGLIEMLGELGDTVTILPGIDVDSKYVPRPNSIFAKDGDFQRLTISVKYRTSEQQQIALWRAQMKRLEEECEDIENTKNAIFEQSDAQMRALQHKRSEIQKKIWAIEGQKVDNGEKANEKAESTASQGQANSSN